MWRWSWSSFGVGAEEADVGGLGSLLRINEAALSPTVDRSVRTVMVRVLVLLESGEKEGSGRTSCKEHEAAELETSRSRVTFFHASETNT